MLLILCVVVFVVLFLTTHLKHNFTLSFSLIFTALCAFELYVRICASTLPTPAMMMMCAGYKKKIVMEYGKGANELRTTQMGRGYIGYNMVT